MIVYFAFSVSIAHTPCQASEFTYLCELTGPSCEGGRVLKGVNGWKGKRGEVNSLIHI